MQLHYTEQWRPRHWMLPLTMLGIAIMAVFILKTYAGEAKHFLPSVSFIWQKIFNDLNIINVILLIDWILFWFMLVGASIIIPFFIYKSIMFLKVGAHQVSEKCNIETSGWFGMSITLAMFANVSGFAVIMLFGLTKQQDDVLWPFWLAYNLIIALLTLFQYFLYRRYISSSKEVSDKQHSFIVPFALAFMGLNLAGPGAFSSNELVAQISLITSLSMMTFSVFVFWQKRNSFLQGFKSIISLPNNLKADEQKIIWAQQVNFSTALTVINVWQITAIRGYLNYGHNMSEFSIVTKNMMTWGVALMLPLVMFTIISMLYSGFIKHIYTAGRNYIFSLGVVCMLVSTYVMLALFTGTAVKAGLFVKYDIYWNALWSVEGVLILGTTTAVLLLLYKMVIKNNVKNWSVTDVKKALSS